MDICVNSYVKSKKITEKEVSEEYFILNETSHFLKHQLNIKNSELEYIFKTLEHAFTDELNERASKVYSEIQNLIKKMNWEMKECAAFDEKVKLWENQKKVAFVDTLAKKILSKEKN
jgi:hypothetical protein